MVAADCSKRNSHAVLAKEKDNAKHVMIFSENNKIVIEEPATRYTRPTTPFTVKTQTGEERMVSVEVVPDQVAHLLEGQVSVSWARGVLTVDTPAHRVIYNGKTLDVINKAVFAAGDQCGLCGDHNRMRLSDIKSSSQCVHTSLLSMAHSYRVNSAIEQCSPLSSSAVERLSNEKAMCASSPSSPLQVSYSSQVTQAKVLRHAVLHRTGQVCFSKEMLPECDIGFIASETMVQEAGFVCLPAAAAEAKVGALPLLFLSIDIFFPGHPEEDPPGTGLQRAEQHDRHLHHQGSCCQAVHPAVTISSLTLYLCSIYFYLSLL